MKTTRTDKILLFIGAVAILITGLCFAVLVNRFTGDPSASQVMAELESRKLAEPVLVFAATDKATPATDYSALLEQKLVHTQPTPQPPLTVDPAVSDALLAKAREQLQLTVTVAGVTVTLPAGYTLAPPDAELWEGTQEFLGRQSDYGQKDGQEFPPVLRLGDGGYGVSNWFSTKKEGCTVVQSDFSEATSFVDRETYFETNIYDCNGVKYVEASWQISGGRWTAHYFAQTDRYPGELDELFKTVVVPAPTPAQ